MRCVSVSNNNTGIEKEPRMNIEQQLQTLETQIDFLDVNASLAKEVFTSLEARKEQLMQEWRELNSQMIEETITAPLVATVQDIECSLAEEIP
jgi:hypothetical protein